MRCYCELITADREMIFYIMVFGRLTKLHRRTTYPRVCQHILYLVDTNVDTKLGRQGKCMQLEIKESSTISSGIDKIMSKISKKKQ